MTDQEILEQIQPLVKEGMLPCKRALALAEQLTINPAQIGKVCNQNEIRIVNCQLGCFGTQHKNREE